jgi:hypothetical protein
MRIATIPFLSGTLLCSAALLASSSTVSADALKANSLKLVTNGQSRYVITVADDAIPSEQTAAKELSSYLEKISGANIAIKSEKEVPATAPQILIGAGTRVKGLLPKQDWGALEKDGIVIKTNGQNLILAGGRPRGSIYAVYTFLEDTLGVRWWTATENRIPNKKTVSIGAQNVTYKPQLQTREAFYFAPDYSKIPAYGTTSEFGTQLKLNGHFNRQGPEFGGHYTNLGWCHTFIQLLPPEKYFRQHPEWYSDPQNGDKPCTAASTMPLGHTWQLCLSNEEARKELTKNALEWIRANPTAGMISIAQNDIEKRCTCDADMAIEKEEGSPSGPLLRFVNNVAEDIEKEYPDFLIETLAYLHTIKTPKTVRPRKNVVITLCSITSDFARPLNSEANKVFRDQMLDWKQITPRLYIWDYVTNFANVMQPHPNMRHLADNIRFFTENNAIGLFEQGDAYSNGVGDFVQLRAWLLSHLMWNPKLDQSKLESEFLHGYYGAAAPQLRAYLNLIQDSYLKKGTPLGTFNRDMSFLNLDVMNQATRHFRLAASAVANDPVLSARVRRERLALDHVWILHYKRLKGEAQTRKATFDGPADLTAFTADFVKVAQLNKAYFFTETNSFDTYATQLLARSEPPAPLPEFARNKPESDVIDIQENVFTLYQAGTQVNITDDAKASNGRVAKMIGKYYEWVVQYGLAESDDLLKNGPWHCYVVAKVQPNAGAIPGPTFSTGIYDTKNNVSVANLFPTLADVKGDDFQVYDQGIHELHSQMSFWAAAPKRDDIDSISIDRFILVREPGAKVSPKPAP